MAIDRIKLTELDFDTIKTNLKAFLKQQTEFQDYDFDGAGLSVLMDLLAYNTHYNAYYLNMVANESFMDTAVLRDSVVSHAKTLGYVPYSYTSPMANVNVTVTTDNANTASLTIPEGYVFMSNQIDGRSYKYVTLDSHTVTKSNTSFYFENIPIYEGQLNSYTFAYDEQTNPKQIFTIPDDTVDTGTVKVVVRPSTSNTEVVVYSLATDILDVSATDKVFFIQEGRAGKYEIYFGNDTIGASLSDGSTVTVTYLTTKGSESNGTDNFIATSQIDGYSNITVSVNVVGSGGSERETVDSIKFSAPLQYSTQNRLVTIKDYESYIKRVYPRVDSISVWGGEDEVPPVYGKVYISIKPKDNYYISELEKTRIVTELVDPKSILTVKAEIREPEYLYLLIDNYVKYDKRKTVQSADTIKNNIRTSIIGYINTNLNKFGARFALSKMQDEIDDTNLDSIIGSETIVRLQKRFKPSIGQSDNYTINFNAPLHRGTLTNKLVSSNFDVYDSTGTRRTVHIEESAQSYTGIEEIQMISPGSGYTSQPTITITGDGTGATASAVIVDGKIQSITVTNRGTDYTRAIITITGGNGFGASATAVITARTGTLRTDNVGIIEYDSGTITLNDLTVLSVSTDDGYLRLTCESEKGIVESARNTILTLDVNDPSSIVTELVAI
jgi:hypothetical protein